MTKIQIFILLAVTSFIFSSCATILNSKKMTVVIATSEPGKIVVQGDTIHQVLSKNYARVYRNKKPLVITAFTDSLTKSVVVPSKNSFAYLLNLYPAWHLWTGFLIDRKNPKRYTYPQMVYIDFQKKDSAYMTFLPLKKDILKYSNILKITPLKIISIANPAVEVSYERRTGPRFSTQGMASWLLPARVGDWGSDFKPHIKGFSGSIEERYYFQKSAPFRHYLGFEVNYLKNRYYSIDSFHEGLSEPDDSTAFLGYRDTFGVKKQVLNFSLKWGYQYVYKRFAVDFYAGLGVRYKNAIHFDRINPKDVMVPPKELDFYYLADREGKYNGIYIPLNLKIGWTF